MESVVVLWILIDRLRPAAGFSEALRTQAPPHRDPNPDRLRAPNAPTIVSGQSTTSLLPSFLFLYRSITRAASKVSFLWHRQLGARSSRLELRESLLREEKKGGGREERGRKRRKGEEEKKGGAASPAMGQAFRKLFDRFFGLVEMRVAMLGLDAAGKTTILYKLHIGEVLSTVPTIGFNVEKVQYKNVVFTVWDVGGQEKLRPLWRHYFSNTDALIYVVDSLDRERIGKAKEEFQTIIRDPFMLNSVILVFANKQDLRGAMTPMEVAEGLGLHDLRNRTWHAQGTCALTGTGLYEGLDWLVSALKELQVPGRHPT